jgi:translation initiation factor eIF-2B subunit beta
LERQGSVADASLSAVTNSLFAEAVNRKGSSDSLIASPPVMTPRDEVDDATRSKNLRPFISQVIEEVLGELETTHDDVAKDAKEHIHSSCVSIPVERDCC